MAKLVIPSDYDPKMTIRETEKAIRYIRETFQTEFGTAMNLERISAPMFVKKSSGLNDNLSGWEKPVSFTLHDGDEGELQIVHSLAKWKRWALKHYGFGHGEGLFTNMNAIRKDEEVLDNLHSVYVDQWDWEKVIDKSERTEETLRQTVQRIFETIKGMEYHVRALYPQAAYHLPEEISFVTSEELEARWPSLTPSQREDKICQEKGAVFLEHIGGALPLSKKPHDLRAPDYDDWTLNGDLLFWYEPLQRAFEVSSMGIRVDEDRLKEQLKLAGAEDRLDLPFHQALLKGDLPYSIGGGIGQSRLCMLLLGKAHIGEVQASIWPDEIVEKCQAAKIQLL